MKKTRNYHGFFTVDAIGSLLVMVILIPILNSLWQTGVNYQKKRAVAEHFMAIQQAAAMYAKQNHYLLMPQITETSGPAITVANLKNANCLPNRYSEVNAWGQGYTISARKDNTGNLAMVVITTGGRGDSESQPDFANIQVPETAALAKAGYIPTGLVGAGNVLRGSYGGWEIPLASMGLNGAPGHLGSVSTLSSADLDQDYLYRVEVPGRPELNAMQTSLNMGGNSITNVGSIGFESTDISSDPSFCTKVEDEGKTFLDRNHGLYLCRNGQAVLLNDTGNSLMMQEATLGWNDQVVDKPVCPEGTGLHPEIFVSPSVLAAGAETPPIASMQAWATNLSDTQWKLQMRILTSNDEWIYPAPDYGRMLVMTTCAK